MCEPGGMMHTVPGILPEADTGGFGLACKRYAFCHVMRLEISHAGGTPSVT